MLTYVITLHLVRRGTSEVTKLIPTSIVKKKIMNNDIEESILCLDQIRHYYLMIEEEEMYHCKTTTTGSYECTQSHTAMCSDWQETWAVKLLQQRGNIIKTWERRLVELKPSAIPLCTYSPIFYALLWIPSVEVSKHQRTTFTFIYCIVSTRYNVSTNRSYTKHPMYI